MRVAIEAASLASGTGGLARYTTQLSLALARAFPEDRYALISDQPFPLPDGAPPNLERAAGPRGAIERRWWLWGCEQAAARWGAEAVHGPDFAVPYLARRPSVMTVHDLSPWMDPGWHSTAARVRRRTPWLLRAGRATMVIVPARSVRRQVLERWRLEPDRVVAIAEAAAPWLLPVEAAAGPPAPTPYLLFLGTLEPRKNLETLVEAWRVVRRGLAVDLVLAGRRRADGPLFAPEPGLRLAGEVPDSELARLYSGAVALVYPSHYEGFGLPVVEAMQCGAPVIASPAVAEAAGDAACYFAGANDLAEAMRRMASDAQWRANWREKSLGRAAEFSWERTARRTREIYREAIERFGEFAGCRGEN
jgi:glycosyltransferase involved in cell wall biosynthesis